jgi:hypothetical protein
MKVPLECEECNGSGKTCECCNEPEDYCRCCSGCGQIYDCNTCDGSGEIDVEEEDETDSPSSEGDAFDNQDT